MVKPTKEHKQLFELTKLKEYIEKLEAGEYEEGNIKIKGKLDELDAKWKLKVKNE